MCQRCADRFLLPKFRVTVTVASKVLLHDHEIIHDLVLPLKDPNLVTEEQWMMQIYNGWF